MHVLLLETIALVGATVHTMEPGPEPGSVAEPVVATVLIEDGLVSQVGPDVEPPEGARVVELTGLHLVPGLIDAYATFDAEHDAIWLAAGVTSVRDAGSPIAVMLPEASPSMRDRGPGPKLLVSSPVFGSTTSIRPDAFLLGGAEAAAVQLDELIKLLTDASARVDYFQFDGSLDGPQHRVVCQYAREYGVEAWGPIPFGLDVPTARANGQRALVGLESLLQRGERFETLGEEVTFEERVRALGEGGWMVAPMLMGTARIVRGATAEGEPRALPLLGRAYEVAWRADLEAFAILRASDALGPVQFSLERQRRLVKDLHDAGVALVPASGAPSGGIAPGYGLVDELEEWAAAGIGPAELLRLATSSAATALGLGDERGRIAPGLSADLVALSSDPRRSVAALRSPELLVVRGQVRESFDLEDSLTALARRNAAIRAERSRPITPPPPPLPEGETLLDGVVDIVNYGERSSVERYTVVRRPDGRLTYGARVRILPTADEATREFVVVQTLRSGLVEEFDLTLDVLDEKGEPLLSENGAHSFTAIGRRVGDTRKIAIERSRGGVRFASQRVEEALAAVDGSTMLLGLIGAMHFPEGPSYVVGFDGVAMEPIVDRVDLQVSEKDGRIVLSGSRSGAVFGFSEGGEPLFGARASNGGRVEVEATYGLLQGVPPRALPIPADRRFTGDPARWREAGPPGDADATGDADPTDDADEGGGK
ncbi:MAG: amidohydrolase family protein [Planctomycetota bacterium]